MHVNGEIEHKGKVIAIHRDTVDVSIEVSEACASCKVKGMCGMHTTEEKVIRIATPAAPTYAIGEDVIVAAAKVVGIKAVILAYMVPFVLMLVTLLGMLGGGIPELTAGLTTLIVVSVYYFILYLFRNKIEKEIIFKLRKTE